VLRSDHLQCPVNPTDRLQVALLTPCFWPEVRRGSERFVREFADGLLARGHSPTVITSHRGLPGRRVENGAEILRLPRPPQGPLVRRNYELYLSHVPLSYVALRFGSYDVAHSVWPADAAAAARWKRNSGGLSVLSYMGTPEQWWLAERRKRRELLIAAMRGCDAVVALSKYAGDAFRQLGYEAPVIAPGVDLNAFRPGDRRSEQPTIICSAAAEEPRKNVRLLIDALHLVRDELPEARLVLSRPRDSVAVRRNGIDLDAPGVMWRDLDDRRVLARAYQEAWIAVLASSHEAFGLVLAEAMACGTPVVGYDHAGLPELIDSPGVGHLFQALEPRALADAMLQTLELSGEPATRERCRERVAEFSVERCTERYLDLYAERGAAGARATGRRQSR
jgi:glycosyltransferase involved in cell wall biosynthesis